MRRAALAAIIALPLAASVVARAQAAELPAAGARVRVTSLSVMDGRVVGQVVSWRGDTLRLRPDGWNDTIQVLLPTVTRLEVSRGTRSSWRRSGAIGFGIGAAIGALVGGVAGAEEDCTNTFGPCGAGFGMAILGFLGGTVGGLIGMIRGSRQLSDQWEPVALPAR